MRLTRWHMATRWADLGHHRRSARMAAGGSCPRRGRGRGGGSSASSSHRAGPSATRRHLSDHRLVRATRPRRDRPLLRPLLAVGRRGPRRPARATPRWSAQRAPDHTVSVRAVAAVGARRGRLVLGARHVGGPGPSPRDRRRGRLRRIARDAVDGGFVWNGMYHRGVASTTLEEAPPDDGLPPTANSSRTQTPPRGQILSHQPSAEDATPTIGPFLFLRRASVHYDPAVDRAGRGTPTSTPSGCGSAHVRDRPAGHDTSRLRDDAPPARRDHVHHQ